MQTFTDADALTTLAERTGGRLAVGNWMIEDVIQEIIADLDDYYSLGYRATSDGSDRTRRISVRMKDPALRARTRESFVEKSRLSHVRDQLLANLAVEPARGEIELEVIELEPDKTRRHTLVPLEVRIPLDQLTYAGDPPMSKVRLLSTGGSIAGNASGITEEQKQISKPPADLPSPYITWEVRVKVDRDGGKAAFAVFDEISGLAGYATIDRTEGSLERRRQEELASMNQWQRELVQAHESRKPILVYFRPERCAKRVGFRTTPICEPFERDVLAHPEIERRLATLEMIRWEPYGQIVEWPDWKPGLALMRVDGEPISRFKELPDGANMARVLDAIAPHSSEIVRINELIRDSRGEEADLATAMLQLRLGLRSEAAEILEQLKTSAATPAVRELAAVRHAFLDARERSQPAMQRLRTLSSEATDRVARAEAWLAIAALSENGDREEALRHAIDVAPHGSSQWTIAKNEISSDSPPVQQASLIRIAPVAIASGRTEIRTIVQTTAVDKVEFVLDGRLVSTDDTAPFRAVLDLERVPARHELRVTARGSDGAPIGQDRAVLNGRAEFWVRIVSPETTTAAGITIVRVALGTPETRDLDELTLTVGDDTRTLSGPPWSTEIEIDPDTVTVIEARAVLDDGTVATDTRILNMSGAGETAGVHLVELPVIPSDSAALTANELTISEDGVRREIQALVGSDEVPLTFGLVIDTSASMADRILDVQSASTALVEELLQSKTRGFLISFASDARIEVDLTNQAPAVVSGIRGLTPGGATTLYDAIMLGLLQFEPLGGRRALIVFSDGDDSASRYKIEDVAEVARRAGVPIYLVRARGERVVRKSGPGASFITQPAPQGRVGINYHQQARLERLTQESGGGYFQLDSLAQVNEVFSEISELVSRQVIVTYLTETGGSEEWRTVEVERNGPGEVRTPRGYYARPGS